MKKIIISIAITVCSAQLVIAQSIQRNVIASAGNIATAGTVTLSSTVGETFTSKLSSANNSITQGFQQGNIIVARMSESEPEEQNPNSRITDNAATFHFNVYPNPATDYVNVRINQTSFLKFKMMLVDETGKLIRNVELTDSETQIDFTQLAAGKYFITVSTNDGKQKESFKIIKVN